jgi:hypothetical protein
MDIADEFPVRFFLSGTRRKGGHCIGLSFWSLTSFQRSVPGLAEGNAYKYEIIFQKHLSTSRFRRRSIKTGF